MPSMAADWVLAGSTDQGQTKLGERDEVTGDCVRHAGCSRRGPDRWVPPGSGTERGEAGLTSWGHRS